MGTAGAGGQCVHRARLSVGLAEHRPTHDLNQKNTTLSLGFAVEFDPIKAVVAAAELRPAFVRVGAQQQRVAQRFDLLAGVTQVMSRTG